MTLNGDGKAISKFFLLDPHVLGNHISGNHVSGDARKRQKQTHE